MDTCKRDANIPILYMRKLILRSNLGNEAKLLWSPPLPTRIAIAILFHACQIFHVLAIYACQPFTHTQKLT